jgi:antitoxin (DNA-binding transcriptional repressor) of toxin-antitoxin stability system
VNKKSISVTEAARNFADCVNRAYYQKMTFVLLRNGSPVAQLGPQQEKICRGRELAEILASAELPETEARTWHEEMLSSRKALQSPSDKWQ